MRLNHLLAMPLFLLWTTFVIADDWPQWLGPRRDSVWREKGIVDRLPEGGPKIRWRAEVGWGYTGPAVAEGRVYVMDYVRKSGQIKNNPGARDTLTGTERVLCFDAASGKLLWNHEYERPYSISYGGGPRCTPTVAGDKVYALGAEGNLWCLEAATGKAVWSVDFVEDYGAKIPIWGIASHPLVEGELLISVVGGDDSVAVAFHKDTGREVWRALAASEQGYCPPTIIEHGGARQLLVWHADSINSLNPLTGETYWSVAVKPRFGMSITTPRRLGPYLFVSGYGEAAMLKLAESEPAAEILWRAQANSGVFSANCTPFLEDGTIYGCDVESGALTAADIESGERLWETLVPTSGGQRRDRYGTAFLVKHDDRFFLFTETGDLVLAELSRAGYRELDRFHVLEPTNQTFGRPVVWSHPAFADRSMYARNDKELVCVDLAAEE